MKKLVALSITTLITLNMATSAFAMAVLPGEEPEVMANGGTNRTLVAPTTAVNEDEKPVPILISANPYTVTNDITVMSNGKKFEFTGDILNVDGTTFFPMREVLNNLGVSDDNITWNANDKSVTFKEYNHTATFTIGSTLQTVDGNESEMLQAPFIYNERTYLPIRYAAQSLGFEVSWDEPTRTIVITKDGVISDDTTFVDATLLLNGSEVTVDSPVIRTNDVVYYPVIELATALGGEDFVTNDDMSVNFTNKVNGDTIKFNRYSNEYTVNDKVITADNDTITYDDTVLYAPLTDIANSLGYKVSTDESNENAFGLTKSGLLTK